MRANEIVTESLNKPAKWVIDRVSKTDRKYTWRIGDNGYALIAARIKEPGSDKIKGWDISFSIDVPVPGAPDDFSFTATGSGNELTVFATVIDIILKDIIPNVDPDVMLISADKVEGDDDRPTNRARLYERMIKRYLPPGYTFEVLHNDSYSIEYKITKAKTDEIH